MTAFLRMVLVLLALVMAVAAPSYLMRESLLEWAIKAALAYNGVKGAKFTVTLAQLNAVKIENISLAPSLGARSLSVFFSPAQLIDGRVREINLVGLDLDVSAANDLLAGLFLDRKPSSHDHSATAFPMPLINIQGAMLRKTRGGVNFSVLVDGSIAADWSGTLYGGAEMAIDGQEGALKAQWLNAKVEWRTEMDGQRLAAIKADFSGDFYSPLVASSDLSGAAGYAETGGIAFQASLSPQSGGWLTVTGHHDLAKAEGSLKLTAAPLVFKENGLLAEQVFPLIRGFDVSGAVAGGAIIAWSAGGITAKAKAEISNAAMTINGVRLQDLGASLVVAIDQDQNLAAGARIERLLVRAKGQETIITNAEAEAALAPAHAASGFRLERAELKSFSLAMDGVGITDAAAKVNVLDPRPGEGIILLISGGRALLDLFGHRLALGDLGAEISFNPQYMAVAASLQAGTLSHEAKKPLFQPARLNGKAVFKGNDVNFQGQASILQRPDGGGDLRIKGSHDLASGLGLAEITLAPLAFFPSGGVAPSDLSAIFRDLEKVSGEFMGQAKIHWASGLVDGSAELAINDWSFSLGTTEITGLNLALRLDGLSPPFMKNSAEIKAKHITDAISLDHPRLRFRIKEGGKIIHIPRAEASLISGVLSIDDAHIDLSAPANRLVLKLTGMDLERMMKLLNIEGVSGTGVLNGDIPLEIRKDKVLVLDGRMAASTPGALHIRSQQAKQALAGGGEQVDLLLQVLDDFRYRRLSVMMNNNQDGEASILLNAEGANPAVLEGFPFNINLNLSANLNKMLAMLLDVYRFSGNAIRSVAGNGQR